MNKQMKKVITIILAGLMVSAQVFAVSVKEVCGQFDGMLNIDGQVYPNKAVFLLPGAVDNAVTFVLPDFKYNAGKLGNIVLPNIPMDANGQLTLENATLYLDSISERATITVINGLEDGGMVYNSVVSESDAMVLLSIGAPSLPEPILVLFVGTKASEKNCTMTNLGFEGEWKDGEPAGWHSFITATGLMCDFVKSEKQFVQSNDVRPGSTGTQSVMLSSDWLFGVSANGNCTNGQINAGSTTADDPVNNYNFSDPTNEGFNTPFHGRPDSIAFWAKYIPADRDVNNEVNKARLSAVLTTDARYQDPETGDFANARLAAATVNYAATPDFGWQRIAVPFEYTSDEKPAYILTTFTTNQVPGGGSAYSTGSSLNKVTVLDTVYLDDVEIIYNRALESFTIGGESVSFVNNVANVEGNYCDDCAKFAATADGVSAQNFIAFDATHKCIFIYVIADDYTQSGEYSIYRVDFADSQTEDLNPMESVENVSLDGLRFEKVLLNGTLYFRCVDVWYNINGMRVR